MTTRRRRRFTGAFNKRVVLEALGGGPHGAGDRGRHEVHLNQVCIWEAAGGRRVGRVLRQRPRAPPPPTAPRGSTPRADVTAARDEHLRHLADLERRQTGRPNGDQRPPPRGHDPGRPRPLHAGRHVARPPLDDEDPQLGDDAERSRRPPHGRASRRARSGTSPRRGTRAAGRPSRG